jgi:hypothetical protein
LTIENTHQTKNIQHLRRANRERDEAIAARGSKRTTKEEEKTGQICFFNRKVNAKGNREEEPEIRGLWKRLTNKK